MIIIDKICCVDGCNNKIHGKGYCGKHYAQYKKYGKILGRTIYTPNEIILYKDYAEIVLYNKKCEEIARTMIDLEDIEKCKQYKWGLSEQNYVVCSKKIKGKTILLHRFLMNAKNDEVVDHRYHNELDNRKSNLRVCTQQQNSFNLSKPINNTSGIIGVWWDKSRNKWCAEIMLNRKKKFLGRRENKDEAIKLRLEAELKYFGKDFAPQREMFEQYGIEVTEN